MPHFILLGLSKKEYGARRIAAIEAAITGATLSIPELGLTAEDLSFSFPHDPSVTSDRVPVIIFVELLFKKPKRTRKVKNRLAFEVAARFKGLPGNENRMIEVRTNTFDPRKEGYACIKP